MSPSLYITANARLMQDLVRRHPAQAHSIVTVDDFLVECWKDCQDSGNAAFARRIIDKHSLRELWRKIVADSTDQQNLNYKRLADLSYSAVLIAMEWDLSITEKTFVDQDHAFFAGAYQQLLLVLAERKLIPNSMLAAELTRLQAQSYLTLQIGEVQLIGFIDPPAGLCQWINCLRTQLSEPQAFDNPEGTKKLLNTEAYETLNDQDPRSYENDLYRRTDTVNLTSLGLSESTDTTVHSYSDEEAELRGIAQHILRLELRALEDSDVSTRPRYTVVIPDLSQRLDKTLRIFSEELEQGGVIDHTYALYNHAFDVSVGRPLHTIPIVYAALSYSDPSVFPALNCEQADSLKRIQNLPILPYTKWRTLFDLSYRSHRDQLEITAINQLLRRRAELGSTASVMCRLLTKTCNDIQNQRTNTDQSQFDGPRDRLFSAVCEPWTNSSSRPKSATATFQALEDFSPTGQEKKGSPNFQYDRARYVKTRYEHAETLRAHLQNIGWPGQQLNANDYHAQAKFFDVLDAMAFSDENIQSYNEFYSDFKERLEREIFHPPAAKSRVNICTENDALSIEHDHLFLTGCADHQLPEQPNSQPFIPYSVLESSGYRKHTFEGQLKNQCERLENYRNHARALYCSYVDNLDEQPAFASPLITAVADENTADLRAVFEASQSTTGNANRHYLHAVESAGKRKSCAAVNMIQSAIEFYEFDAYQGGAAPPLKDSESIKGGSTAVKMFIANPFTHFAQFRLRLQQDETAVSGITKRDWGDIIHKALESIYDPTSSYYLGGSAQIRKVLENTVSDASTSEIGSHLDERIRALFTKVKEALRNAINVINPRYLSDLSPTLIEAAEDGGARTILSWLQDELARSDYTIHELEKSVQIKFRSHQQTEHELRLRIDRLDLIPANNSDTSPSLAIIDYKTGNAPSYKSLFGNDITEPQAALYYYALKQQDNNCAISHIGFAQLKKDAMKRPYLTMPFDDGTGRVRKPSGYDFYQPEDTQTASRPNLECEVQWSDLIEHTLQDIVSGSAYQHDQSLGKYQQHLDGLARTHCNILSQLETQSPLKNSNDSDKE